MPGLKYPVLASDTGGDDALMKSYRRRGARHGQLLPYTLGPPIAANQQFVAGMVKDYGTMPGQYAALLYVNGQVVDAALKTLNGKANDKDALIKALRA